MLPSLALRTKEMRQLLPEQGPTSESRPLLIKSASPIRAAQTQHPYRPPAFSKARTAKAQNDLGFFVLFYGISPSRLPVPPECINLFHENFHTSCEDSPASINNGNLARPRPCARPAWSADFPVGRHGSAVQGRDQRWSGSVRNGI